MHFKSKQSFNKHQLKLNKMVKKILIAFLLIIGTNSINAITITDTAIAQNVQVSLKPELVRLAFSVGGTGTTGSYLDIKLPSGFTWEGIAYGPIVIGGSGSNSMTYAGIVGGKLRITFGSSTALQTIRLGFYQKASCGSGTSSFITRDSLFFYEGSGTINTSVTNNFIVSTPSLSLTSINNTPNPSSVGGNVVRNFTITNGGFGATSQIKIVDNYLNGAITINTTSFRINPTGVNYTMPNANIVNNGDSVIISLLPTQIQQIGDGDTLLENGESFVLQYSFQINNCGTSNLIPSNLSTWWGCGGSICQKSSAITDVSIPNTVPSISWNLFQNKINSCWDNHDTAIVRFWNTSTSKAANVFFSVSNGTSLDHLPSSNSLMSRLDTSRMYFKRGINGIWRKPVSYQNYEAHTAYSAWFGSFQGAHRVDVGVDTLGVNDTIYLMIPYYKPCPANNGRNALMPGCGGTATWFWGNYKGQVRFTNVCNTVSYNTNSESRWFNGRYSFLYNNNQAIVAPTDANAGETINVDLQENYCVRNINTTVHKHRFVRRIDLPNGLVYSGANPLVFGTGNRDTLTYDATNRRVWIKFVSADCPTFQLPLTVSCGSGGLGVFTDRLYMLPPSGCASSCDSVYFSSICTRTINIHCPNPCPRGGYTAKSLKAYRVNYGLPDNDNNHLPDVSGSINLNTIRTDRFIAGDTMEILSTGKISVGGQSPIFTNGYASIFMPNTWFTGVTADVFLKDTNNAGSSTNYTISNIPISTVVIGGNRVLRLDFSVANLSSGGVPNTYVFGQNDSLSLKIRAALNSNTPNGLDITGYTFTDTIYVSPISNPSNDTMKYACDNYSGSYNLVGAYRFASGDGSNGIAVNGCNGGEFRFRTYQRVGGAYPGGNVFPNEYRVIMYPDSFYFDLPSGYSVKKSVVYWLHSDATHTDTISVSNIIGNRYIYRIRPMVAGFGGTRRISDEGDIVDLGITLVPNCRVSSGTIPSVPYGQYWSSARPWVTNWGTSKTLYNASGAGGSTFPIVQMNNLGPQTKQLFTNTTTWDFSVQNNAISAASPLTWVKLQTNNIIIDSVRNLTSNAIISTVNGFYRLGNIAAGGSPSNFRIYAKTSSCNNDSIRAFIGWDCIEYPTSFVGPEDSVIYAGQTNLKVNARLFIPANATIPSNANIQAKGKITIMPNVSIGTGTTITSSVSVDVRSPNLFWPGVTINIGPVDICDYSEIRFYLQPQPAAIQTQVTPLTMTPSDPSNASSADYGNSTIYMCQGFPFEMEIQATQPGNLYNVKEVLSLPFNGGTGLDYISDSGYIEYPIGTTPRLFSSTANTAILAQVPTGSMTLDLAQIDPTNFGAGTNGLAGTGLGTNSTRRVILRWKMKSNCDLVSGDQWQPTQQAVSPCGSPASGNNTTTSGFMLALAGVSNPYVATVKVSTGLDGCGSQTTQIRLEKTGATAPQPTDSITIRLPLLVAAGSMTCSGTACPGGSGSTQSYSVRTDATYQYLSFQYPNTAGANGDTLLYSFPMRSRNKSTCENNQTVRADVFQQLTIYCGAPIPANLCPNSKSSLGTETKSFDIRKAILGFSGYNSTYIYPSFYKYRFGGNVVNSSTAVSTNAGVTLKTFFDINNNLTYEKNIDSLVKTTVISSPISTSGSVGFIDSFENFRYQPRPTLPMYTVIDTGDASANCFCGGVVQSAFNQALPIEFLELNAININNVTAKVQWTTNADNNTIGFHVYRRTENETSYSNIGYVVAQKGNMAQSQYNYYDPISTLSEGRIYYQIEAISQDQINKMSKVVSINKTGLMVNNNLFTMSPNPSNQFVKINLGEGLMDGEVIITDVNGKLVYQSSFKGFETIVKTSELAQGVYTVSVKTTDLIEVQKLSVIK